MAKRAAIYMRVSTNRQEENYSFDDQHDKTHTHCQEGGYQVVMEERDVHTGYELDERPGLTRIREAVLMRRIDVIVVVHLDRLARNQTHQEVLFYETCRRDIEIEAVEGEKFDDTPIGRHIRYTLGFVAEMEREDIRRRTSGGKLKRAERGENMPSYKPLYGFLFADATKQQLIPDPIAAPVVQQIFTEFASGSATLRSIAKFLDDHGYLSPNEWWRRQTGQPLKGEHWHASVVRRIILNDSYLGRHAAFNWETKKVRTHDPLTGQTRTTVLVRNTGANAIPQPGVAPALVTDEVATAARARLDTNREFSLRNNKLLDKDRGVLRGFVFCGQCGHKMYLATSKYRTVAGGVYRVEYFCPSTRKMVKPEGCPGATILDTLLDTKAWAKIRHLIEHPEEIAQQIEEFTLRVQVPVETLAMFTQQEQDLLRQQSNLVSSLAQTDSPTIRETIMARLQGIDQQLAAIRDEIAKRQGEQLHRQQHVQRLRDLEEWCHAALPVLDRFTTDQKRLVCAAFGVKVLVWRKEHFPRYRVYAQRGDDLVDLDTGQSIHDADQPVGLWSILDDLEQAPQESQTTLNTMIRTVIVDCVANIKSFVSQVIRRYELTLVPNQEIVQFYRVTAMPLNGIRLRVTERAG